MLRVADLSLGFTRYSGWLRREVVWQLRGLSFTLARGEVLAVIGASGAGKSLLAQALTGLLPPNAQRRGAVVFDGLSLEGQWPRGLLGRRIGLMPQALSHLDPRLPAGRQIALAARRAGAEPLVAERLEALGLGPEVAALYPAELSGGMARRVLLAMARAGAPELLIADEPTAGLDPESRVRILAELARAREGGRALLVITHDLRAVLPLADRVLVLKDGLCAGVEAAAAFRGQGQDLRSPYARALWQALPEQGFGLLPAGGAVLPGPQAGFAPPPDPAAVQGAGPGAVPGAREGANRSAAEVMQNA